MIKTFSESDDLGMPLNSFSILNPYYLSDVRPYECILIVYAFNLAADCPLASAILELIQFHSFHDLVGVLRREECAFSAIVCRPRMYAQPHLSRKLLSLSHKLMPLEPTLS